MAQTEEASQVDVLAEPAQDQQVVAGPDGAAEQDVPQPEAPAGADDESSATAVADPAADEITAEVTAATTGQDAPAPKDRVAQLEREGEAAADFLERLLDIADMDGDIDVDIDGDRASVAIVDSEEGAVPRRLVGSGGAVLEALQELTRLAVQSATGERSRLMLDVAGFRAERRAALVQVARRAIDQAKETKEPVALEPMTAFERKVVHDEVAEAGLFSESEGSEPSRHVVITLS